MKHSLFAAMMCAAMAFSDTGEVAGVGNVTVPSTQQLHTLDLEATLGSPRRPCLRAQRAGTDQTAQSM